MKQKKEKSRVNSKKKPRVANNEAKTNDQTINTAMENEKKEQEDPQTRLVNGKSKETSGEE